MENNERWEELKEVSSCNIQNGKEIRIRQIRSIRAEEYFEDIKEIEKFRRFYYRSAKNL